MLILNLLGVSLTLLLMLAVFCALNARSTMQRQSTSMLELAHLIATNAAPILEQHDRHAADALLSSLSSSSEISQAAIFDQRGTIFTSWSSSKAIGAIGQPDLQISHPIVNSGPSRLEIDTPIFISGRETGILRLHASKHSIGNTDREFALIGMAFTLGAIALLVLILHRYQLCTLTSMLEMSEVANRIVQEHDHNLRTKFDHGDGLSHLTQRFNQLLKQLDTQPGTTPTADGTPEASAFDKLIDYGRLTRLPGRDFFRRALSTVVQGAKERHELAVLMLIWLDDLSIPCIFTNTNTGSDVLQHCAKRMALTLRSSDLLCHLGGGQFAVILPIVHRMQQVQLLAERLMEAAGGDEEEAKLRISIGIACCPADADDPFSLMHQADMAMYAAHHSGTNTYRFFDRVVASKPHGHIAGEMTSPQGI